MVSTFHLPTKIIFGAGSVTKIGEEVSQLGPKALLVTYPDIRTIGLLDQAIESLRAKGVDVSVFDKVEPDPGSSTVDKGTSVARDKDVDVIIGLGGGSAMDTAKGIALASASTKSIWYYVETRAQTGRVPSPAGAVPMLIQVPTMAGTGSELNPGAVITNWETHEKRGVAHPDLLAKVAIIDPEVTITVPKTQTAAGGVDIFCHIAEAYITDRRASPLTDGIRETIMKVAVMFLPRALAQPDDIEARTQLSWASTMAMSQFAGLGGGQGIRTCHGIEHALSGYYDVTHGAGLAVLLTAWMRYTLPVRKERFALLGNNVFGEEDGVLATEKWLEDVRMRLRLRDFGCEFDRAEEIAELAVKTGPSLRRHPRPLDAAAIAQIYKESY